jgi:hypothetical protein
MTCKKIAFLLRSGLESWFCCDIIYLESSGQRMLSQMTSRPSRTAQGLLVLVCFFFSTWDALACSPLFLNGSWAESVRDGLRGCDSKAESASIPNTVLAIVTHPEVQVRAQQELVGRDGFFSVSDHASLPYINAILKEVLW